jgi:hypothetical protein
MVRRLHSRPSGLADTCLYPPNWTVCNPWPRWRTTCTKTTGNYWLSRHWWRDLRQAMKHAFLAELSREMEWTEPDWAERRRQVGGVITGLTA